MNSLEIVPATEENQIQAIADLADIIWHEHFTSILSLEQIDYMVDKFQSFPAIRDQIKNGYEYFQLKSEDQLIGYTGVHQENGSLFLSKLYLSKECRGQGISSRAFDFLKSLCKERKLDRIWLTCNKYNSHTLDVYKHFGFETIDSQEADIGNGYIMDDYILEYRIR